VDIVIYSTPLESWWVLSATNVRFSHNNQLFYGCPHMSYDQLDMEDRLSRFLFAQYEKEVPRIAGAVASIQGLARAVMRTNGLYLDSKHALRAHIISVYSPGEGSSINPVSSSHIK
jgi:hypothetical protein